MLPTRLLPPQFLIPSWTPQQVRNLSRTAAAAKKSQRPKTAKGPSLFQELFPEEQTKKQSHELDFSGPSIFDRLPAFAWNEEQAPTIRKLPSEKRSPSWGLYNQIPGRKKEGREDTTISRPNAVSERNQASRKSGATLMVLRGVSKNLEESDFFRLDFKGDHIEGWARGLIKVIPGRKPTTLEPLDHYFLLFETAAAARAYGEQVRHLHRLARMGSAISTLPLPPGFLREGEDVHEVVKGFTLVPAALDVASIKLVDEPYKPALVRLMEDGGPAVLKANKTGAEEKVLFSLNWGQVTESELKFVIGEDGRKRNLQWQLAGGASEFLDLNSTEKSSRRRAASMSLRPARYLISLKDRDEARRFVREWHSRPFPLPYKAGKHATERGEPIVNAQIVW
ncbi:hypothetical protein BP6252_05079 [Coleophoma cylindrospora]|uniref:Uncharacterized protein n=1 Tax=Coleophoma cylindrospora TaxID=1849047 RepID=A0A3D8RSU7_9HELO|nr:hypothetical protein BP6252_05079 [Coleophoma cylindrospora]